MKKIVLILAVAFALGAAASSFEVVAWRGETVAELVPDFAELSSAGHNGIDVRYGVLKTTGTGPRNCGDRPCKVRVFCGAGVWGQTLRDCAHEASLR